MEEKIEFYTLGKGHAFGVHFENIASDFFIWDWS